MVRVWTYLIGALRRIAGGVGETALNEVIRSGGKGPIERWLGGLLNDLAAVDVPTSFLVVDDLNVITDPEIRESFALFTASMPPWLRLIIITRADPPLPLPRLRAEGRLTEIRQRDLRFDAAEADVLLRAQGIDNLVDEQLRWLVERTEGWAAGLQLAMIVLGEQPGADRLFEVAGSNRTFADYIAAEVVDVAAEDMRRFLFTTSVLDRINPSLARAVSGFGDAEQMLRDAQHRGLFLVALDERGEWYRYHALFAEAVQAEARSQAPDLVQLANEHAAAWFENAGDLVLAVDHWLAAGRPDEALRIAVPAAFQLFDAGQLQSIQRIASHIPQSVVGSDAHRQLDYALLNHVVDADVSRWWVNEAEATIAALPHPDEQLTRRAASGRTVCALLFGEWDEAATAAAAAIDPRGVGEGETEQARRAGLQLLRAKAWMELPADAEHVFRKFANHQRISPAVRGFYAPCIWALAAAVGGRIHEAEEWAERATKAADVLAVPPAPYLELLFARTAIHRERGDNDAARATIDELRLGQHGHVPQPAARWPRSNWRCARSARSVRPMLRACSRASPGAGAERPPRTTHRRCRRSSVDRTAPRRRRPRRSTTQCGSGCASASGATRHVAKVLLAEGARRAAAELLEHARSDISSPTSHGPAAPGDRRGRPGAERQSGQAGVGAGNGGTRGHAADGHRRGTGTRRTARVGELGRARRVDGRPPPRRCQGTSRISEATHPEPVRAADRARTHGRPLPRQPPYQCRRSPASSASARTR